MTTTDHPIYTALAAEYPGIAAAMARPRWSYAAASKAADEAVAKGKRPAKAAKRAPRKAS
jgi:hypothetical protein